MRVIVFLLFWAVGVTLCICGWFGTPTSTSILYILVPLTNLVGSFFLIGPSKQAEKVTSSVAKYPALIFVTLIPTICILGLVVANWMAIVLMFAEQAAFLGYIYFQSVGPIVSKVRGFLG